MFYERTNGDPVAMFQSPSNRVNIPNFKTGSIHARALDRFNPLVIGSIFQTLI